MSDDFQLPVSDLLAAYASEIGALTQRAILSEQKAKGLQRMLDEARRERRVETVIDSESYQKGVKDGWDSHEAGASLSEALGLSSDRTVAAVKAEPVKKATARRR